MLAEASHGFGTSDRMKAWRKLKDLPAEVDADLNRTVHVCDTKSAVIDNQRCAANRDKWGSLSYSDEATFYDCSSQVNYTFISIKS
jgi:hypothetical protein